MVFISEYDIGKFNAHFIRLVLFLMLYITAHRYAQENSINDSSPACKYLLALHYKDDKNLDFSQGSEFS